MNAFKISVAFALLTFLTACADNSSSMLDQDSTVAGTVAGTVIGLNLGNELVLQNNQSNTTLVSVNGSFSFAAPVANNESYLVTVLTQPTSQICTVLNGSGTGAMVNLSITCVPVPYIIS